MADTDNIHVLLNTGSWRASRSRSPNPSRDPSSQAYHYQSPRSDARSSRPIRLGPPVRRPPPPTVEGEAESLAREHSQTIVHDSSDDEPKFRGDIDQHPVLVPVSDHNQERRFVIVPSGEGDPDDTGGSDAGHKSDYDANTCKQFVLVNPDEEGERETKERPALSKRKSHTDLPRLETEFHQPESPSPIRRSNSRRNREKPVVEQAPRESTKSLDDVFLSPVVTHTAGGRDRAYLDFNPGPSRPAASSKVASRDGSRGTKYDDKRSVQSSSVPTTHRRMSSTAGSRDARTSERQLADYAYGNPDDALAFMMQGDGFSTSPPKSRKVDSPPYPNASLERLPDRPMGQRSRRESNAREQGEYYGSDSHKSSRAGPTERARPRRPGVEPESLLTPDQARPIPIGRPRSKNPSPLPSPRTSQASFFPDNAPLPSPRSPRSTTLPYPMERKRYDEYSSSQPSRGMSPPRRTGASDKSSRPMGPPRAGSLNSFTNGSATVSLPVPTALPRGPVVEKRPASIQREDSQDTGSPGPYWQPGPFNPTERKGYLDKPVTSLRSYSEDVLQGTLPKLPDCHWSAPSLPWDRAGGTQFLSLARAENFSICPGCFEGVFGDKEEFKHLFIPAPIRSPDQPISCDFGSSPWYRIAFLMTLKYRYGDLRLLEGVAAVAARHQPCPGNKSAVRIWYSMVAPNSRRPISTFSICSTCVGVVGIILPNLAGIFVPLDPYSTPTRRICDLHFSHERKRFLEYFDLLETTSDIAHSRRTAPKVQELADRIRDISLIDECRRGLALQNRKWDVMEGLPEFTVCEECYDAVVLPLIERGEGGDIPQKFFRSRQLRPVASCQLYSDRMREIFKKACRRNDIKYLAMKVRERQQTEADIKPRFIEVQQKDQTDPAVQRERAELIRRLKENE